MKRFFNRSLTLSALSLGLLTGYLHANGAPNSIKEIHKPNPTSSAQKANTVQEVNSIAAVVDNAIITQLDVDNIMRTLPPEHQTANDRYHVLNDLIDRSLLIQAAKRNGLQATTAEVSHELSRIASANHMTVEALLAEQAKRGQSAEAVKKQLADTVTLQKMQQSIALENSNISDEVVDAAIARAKENNMQLPLDPPETHYRLQHILLKGDSDAIRKKINDIYEQARNGASFFELAKQYSEDNSAQSGGDLGWISQGQTVPEFEAAFKALKPHEISRPVQTQFGWHIIKLNAINESDDILSRERSAMRRVLSEERTNQAIEQILQQLRSRAYIQILH